MLSLCLIRCCCCVFITRANPTTNKSAQNTTSLIQRDPRKDMVERRYKPQLSSAMCAPFHASMLSPATLCPSSPHGRHIAMGARAQAMLQDTAASKGECLPLWNCGATSTAEQAKQGAEKHGSYGVAEQLCISCLACSCCNGCMAK